MEEVKVVVAGLRNFKLNKLYYIFDFNVKLNKSSMEKW